MSVRYGMNLLLWTDDPTQESFLPLYERLGAMGFDGLELPIFGGNPEAFASLGKRLEEMGLARTAVTVCNAETNPVSPDPAVRERAGAELRNAVDCAHAAGAELLVGPLFAAIGEFSGSGPTAEEWQHSIDVLGGVADYANEAGLGLGFEFLNRFEIYLLNSAEDTTRYLRDLDRPATSMLYDTFHAHIEQKDSAQAIRENGAAIGHVHISENDRSTPGKGQVAWDATFDALTEIGYDGWLTIEAFGSSLPSLAAATKIWRRMFVDEEQLAKDGLEFMRRAWQRRNGETK